ncbi:hypothetical protein BKA59DRAFT_405342 [Fusarium tricinctum]|uniref:Uncharacterized protein n=1 Tax=Fusarium tricinctum TaxID=61284 RepID=A0A8K0RM14_9HYPO|nr:hypothetical protein BKA59DRAFT_405342 [Fusarium tricinctum]
MPSLEVIQQSNASLRDCHPELTAVMLGATGGIGAATCRELVRQVKRPTLYIVGQNQSRASALILELKALNPTARLIFIQSDLTLLSNVDDVCRQITEREDKINLLFMTAGFLSLQGRDETIEGLDKMYSLQYFARIRAIVKLLPLLYLASHDHQLARVVSVLGAGNEGRIFVGDLELKNNYNLQNCSNQAIAMNSLALEHLARQNPTISFIHAYPGVVRQTGIMSHMGQPLSTIIQVMMFIATPFTTSISTCAKRQLYLSTADVFSPPTEDTKSTTSLASFRVGSNGEICPQNSLLSGYLEDGTLNNVWRFTEAMFKRVSQVGDKTA